MRYVTSKNVSAVFGVAFVAAGLLGFAPNPLVAPEGVFEVNFMHNILHLVIAGVFLFGASKPEAVARITLQGLGIAGVILAILGFITADNMLLGLVHINEADKWLHAGLALVIVTAGFGLPKPRSTETVNA